MIKIRNLTVSFDQNAPVVDAVNLDIAQGQTTAVIGESGSGKSVSIAAILRILPKEAKVKGSITLAGMELLSLTDDELNKLRGKVLGYVPQGGGNSLHPLMTVGAQVAEPIIFHQKEPRKKAFQTVLKWLDKVGLKPAREMALAFPHTLSGGMKQRALIAMGAAGGAKIILADEPTKGLDSKRVEQIAELFSDLEETTILCVTHDLRFAKSIADNICVMYEGQVVELTDAESFFKEPKHPYSQMLLSALPENGLNCPEIFTPPTEQREGCLFYHRCPKRNDDCKNKIPMISVGHCNVRCVQYAVTS